MRDTLDIGVQMTGIADALAEHPREKRREVLGRSAMIALIAFLTLIDLFGSQAVLPQLVEKYQVSPAAMGVAVNASTIGMALASLVVAVFARRINRRKGIWISLMLLAIPTTFLAFADDLTTFAALRVVQGIFMATAFTLTLTYLSEWCTLSAMGGAMAAYITGNVASNLFGRVLATEVANGFGLTESFICFAALNLLGALLAFLYFNHRPTAKTGENQGSVLAAWADHARNRALLALLLIGFLLLFVFVATFTYASFVLASDRFALSQGMLGLVFLVFAPSILTTPFAAAAIARRGMSWTFQAGIGASIVGLALLVLPWLASFLLGLTLVAAGLFFAQSVATASIRNAVTHDQAAANGLYLACYYLGGLVGAVVVGQVFDLFGWTAAVTLMLGCVLLASVLSRVALRGSVQPALSS